MSDTPERIWLLWREIGLVKGRVTCSEQDHTDEGFPEYIRADLHEAALATERARADKAEAERDAAIAAASKAARLRGEAEGKLLAAETPGVLEGWRRRAEKAEAERDALTKKLATAMYVLREMRDDKMGFRHVSHFRRRATVTIAELTGGGNDRHA